MHIDSLALPGHLVERAFILLVALALDAVIGDLPKLFARVPHPVVLAGRTIAFFEKTLNRETRTDADRRVRGVATMLILVGGAALLGLIISAGLRPIGADGIGEVALVCILLAQRSLYDHVKRVADGLQNGGLAGGRDAIRHIVGRDPASLDIHGVVRAGIESLAENFSDGVVGPALAYLAFGLPGIFAYKMTNTLDSMIGYRSPRYLAFGWASARFDDLVNLIPARLSGVLIAIAACFIGNGAPRQGFRIMWRDAMKHRSPNAGWPEAAMAGALGLALLGPRHYGTVVVTDPWLGDGRARAELVDLRRSLQLYIIACLLLAGLVAGIALIFGG